MDFDTKASNIIHVIFQMKVIFQQNVFLQHTYACLNEKLVQMFFEKWHESNFSILIEMVQSIIIQYNMTSSSFSIIWIIFRIYLHSVIYHDNI
jgi:hypothetical protein